MPVLDSPTKFVLSWYGKIEIKTHVISNRRVNTYHRNVELSSNFKIEIFSMVEIFSSFC